jgi:hypothetical protein
MAMSQASRNLTPDRPSSPMNHISTSRFGRIARPPITYTPDESRIQRRRSAPTDTPVIKTCRYVLDKPKALYKKADQCNRNETEIVHMKGNNTKFIYNTAAFEIVQRSLRQVLKNLEFVITEIDETDQEGSGTKTTLKAHYKCQNGAPGKIYSVINIYKTTSTLMVNGGKSYTRFEEEVHPILERRIAECPNLPQINSDIEQVCIDQAQAMEEMMKDSEQRYVDAEPANDRSYIEECPPPEPAHKTAPRTVRTTRDKKTEPKKVYITEEMTTDPEQRPADADPTNDRSYIEESPSSEPPQTIALRTDRRTRDKKTELKKPSKSVIQHRTANLPATSSPATSKSPTHGLPARKVTLAIAAQEIHPIDMCPTCNEALQDTSIECIQCRLLYHHDCEIIVQNDTDNASYVCISCTALGQADSTNVVPEPDHRKAKNTPQSKQASDTTRERTIEAKEKTLQTREKELSEKERENKQKDKKLRSWEKNLLEQERENIATPKQLSTAQAVIAKLEMEIGNLRDTISIQNRRESQANPQQPPQSCQSTPHPDISQNLLTQIQHMGNQMQLMGNQIQQLSTVVLSSQLNINAKIDTLEGKISQSQPTHNAPCRCEDTRGLNITEALRDIRIDQIELRNMHLRLAKNNIQQPHITIHDKAEHTQKPHHPQRQYDADQGANQRNWREGLRPATTLAAHDKYRKERRDQETAANNNHTAAVHRNEGDSHQYTRHAEKTNEEDRPQHQGLTEDHSPQYHHRRAEAARKSTSETEHHSPQYHHRRAEAARKSTSETEHPDSHSNNKSPGNQNKSSFLDQSRDRCDQR